MMAIFFNDQGHIADPRVSCRYLGVRICFPNLQSLVPRRFPGVALARNWLERTRNCPCDRRRSPRVPDGRFQVSEGCLFVPARRMRMSPRLWLQEVRESLVGCRIGTLASDYSLRKLSPRSCKRGGAGKGQF